MNSLSYLFSIATGQNLMNSKEIYLKIGNLTSSVKLIQKQLRLTP